ncbi:MAG TPA: glucose-6-phosphate dehydrogenase [Candidatus Dormibacteraeota bacterium]
MAGPVDLVIFGASGDLTARKVLPALAGLGSRNVLPRDLHLVGVGRSDLGTDGFRKRIADAAGDGAGEFGAAAEWVRLKYDDAATYGPLRDQLREGATAIFYLATPPSAFLPIVRALAASGLAEKDGADRRIVLEKPLGQDLASARELNRELGRVFDEPSIFRIDHYLAKDTVQNVLAFRFSNSVFEPIWNRTLIETIQVTAAEDGGIGGRAGYYDRIGALRDMIQNHVLQVLALVTMEPPITFDPEDIRRAKRMALRAIEPLDPATAVRGQYEGYADSEGVDPSTTRETYVAAMVRFDNWRWDGVPMFIRTGKCLKRRVTEVVIRFRDAPHLRLGGRKQRGIPTLLVIRIQPEEGITLRIGAKRPGARFEMVPAGMHLEYAKLSRSHLPDAYEHVLSEVLAGGHNVFPSGEEIELQWAIVEPLIKAWEADGHPELYAPDTWGPGAAEDLVAAGGGGRWINSGDEPGTR